MIPGVEFSIPNGVYSSFCLRVVRQTILRKKLQLPLKIIFFSTYLLSKCPVSKLRYKAMANIVAKIQLLKLSLSHVPTEFQGQPQNDECCNAMPDV